MTRVSGKTDSIHKALEQTLKYLPGADISSADIEEHMRQRVRFGYAVDKALKAKEKKSSVQEFSFSNFTFRPDDLMLVRTDNGEEIILTDRERDILRFMCLNIGQNISRNKLLENVWGYNDQIETHTLETHIYRLRQKIETDPSKPQILITKDSGYCLIEGNE